MTAPGLKICDARFGIRHVPMRMPFRFGMVTLTASAQIHLFLDIETADGRRATGVAADMLAPKWYDKDPDKSYADNLNDLVAGARVAVASAMAVSGPESVYRIWRETYEACQAAGAAAGRNPLLSSNGPSLVERALLDGLGVALAVPYHTLLRDNLVGIDLGDIHSELAGVVPAEVIPERPLQEICVRHTVGLADPIRHTDITAENLLNDGLPQSLEEYVSRQGLSYFKIKVGGDVDADTERLEQISGVLPAGNLTVSLDGNEQYNDPAELVHLLDRLQDGNAATRRLYDAILYLEQPLDRSVALHASAEAVRALSERKPMVIDESDEALSTFRESVDLGYRGVSSKACKGMIKALANLALCRFLNDSAGESGRYFITGEDLTNVAVVALHQDLAHLAALGIQHAERNGHHYVRGLNHLPAAEQDACAERHACLYQQQDNQIALAVQGGRVRVTSLQIPGLGVGVQIDPQTTIALEGWHPEDLEKDLG
jgi:hypothetical protein